MGRPKKVQVITGQTTKKADGRDLEEIVTGRKAAKFGRYADREAYIEFLNGSDHFALCEELLRLGDTPSTDRATCIERCTRKFDTAGKPRIRQNPQLGRSNKKTIEEIINS